MMLTRITFSTPIAWVVDRREPDLWSHTNAFSLLNPLDGHWINVGHYSDDRSVTSFVAYEDDKVYILQNTLYLAGALDDLLGEADAIFHLVSVLKNLTYLKSQYQFGGFTYTINSPLKVDIDSLRGRRQLKTGSYLTFRNYLQDASISFHDFLQADIFPVERKIYVSLFLEALAAAREGNYLKALLYCGMSSEIALTTFCDDVYESALSESDPLLTSRFCLLNKSEKDAGQHDPIYLHLKRSTNFEQKLELLPLYIQGRSLKLEDPGLHLSMGKVYRTRNKIAHAGEVVKSGNVFDADQDGAIQALSVVKSFFGWLGVEANYPIPTGVEGMITLNTQ